MTLTKIFASQKLLLCWNRYMKLAKIKNNKEKDSRNYCIRDNYYE